MEKKRLIKGYSSQVLSEINQIKDDYTALSKVTVFFVNANFLITEYRPLSESVHLILEFEDGKELHVESASCGYGGAGPNATIAILELFGIEKSQTTALIYYNYALRFSVDKGAVLHYSLRSPELFQPSDNYETKLKGDGNSLQNKITLSRNVLVDFQNWKVTFFNPQRICWKGFLNLSSYLKNKEFEYYIGDNSPLEGRFFIGKGFNDGLRIGHNKPDVEGAEHVNLVLHGSNFRLVCLIDRSCEMQVIEAAFLALTGKRLFHPEDYHKMSQSLAWRRLLSLRRKELPFLSDRLTVYENDIENHQIITRG